MTESSHKRTNTATKLALAQGMRKGLPINLLTIHFLWLPFGNPQKRFPLLIAARKVEKTCAALGVDPRSSTSCRRCAACAACRRCPARRRRRPESDGRQSPNAGTAYHASRQAKDNLADCWEGAKELGVSKLSFKEGAHLCHAYEHESEATQYSVRH